MPSVAERTRNNVRTGIFVTVALFLGMAIIIILTDPWDAIFSEKTTYSVVFDVTDGVKTLDEGADVRVGGLKRGSVNSVELTPPDDSSEDDTYTSVIKVTFELDQSIPLFPDARIAVGAGLIGSDAWLDIIDLGNRKVVKQPDGSEALVMLPMDQRVPEGAQLNGYTASMLASFLGLDDEEIKGNFSNTLQFFGSLETKYQGDIKPSLDNIKDISIDTKALIADIRKRWEGCPEVGEGWGDKVNNIVEEARLGVEQFHGAMKDGRELIADAKTVIGENKEDFRTIVSNVKDTTEWVKTDLQDRIVKIADDVQHFLDTGQEGLDGAIALLEDVKRDYSGWSGDIDEALLNANLFAQQLKLAMIEIRHSPWKLLYQPSQQEFQHEMLYDSARAFALAAADLKSASAYVEEVSTKYPEQLQQDPEAWADIQQRLLDSLERYEEAQTRLLDVLLVQP